MSEEIIYAVAMPAELANLGVTVSYSAFWRRAADKLIPSHRKGRFVVIKAADLPEIAAFFRLEAEAKVNRGGRTKPEGRARLTASHSASQAK